MPPIGNNAHLVINYLDTAKQRLQQAGTAGLSAPDQMGLMMASQSMALIDIAMTLRDIRDLTKLSHDS